MATQYQQGAWNSSSILAGYGLMSVIGPQEPTPADIKRLNSRSGGEHAGHGNWMQTFNPRPIIKSGGPTKVYDYGQGSEVVVRSRLPSMVTRKVGKFKGFKKPRNSVKIGKDVDGSQTRLVVGGKKDATTETDKPLTVDTENIFKKNEDVVMEPQSASSTKSSQRSFSTAMSERYVPDTRLGPSPIRNQNSYGLRDPYDDDIVMQIYGS